MTTINIGEYLVPTYNKIHNIHYKRIAYLRIASHRQNILQ